MNDSYTSIEKTNELPLYSPASIINILTNIISIPPTNKIISLRGIYLAKGKEPYSGYYYDLIKDETSDFTLTLLVPALIRNKLSNNTTIEVICYVSKKAEKDGSVRLLANVTDLVSQVQNKYTEDEIRALEIQQQKSTAGFRDLDSFIKKAIFENRKPSVTIVFGKTADIQHDIIDQMGESAALYDIRYVKTTISSIPDLISSISSNNNPSTDVLVIARGGDDKMDFTSEAINNSKVAEVCLNLKPFLVTALGHKVNTPLLERIADKRFITPTAFGQYLKDIYNVTVEELTHSKAKLEADIKVLYDKQIQVLNERLLNEQTLNKRKIGDLTELTNKEVSILKSQVLENKNSYNALSIEYSRFKNSFYAKVSVLAIIAAIIGLVIGLLI